MNLFFKLQLPNSRAFTLVEMIVSLAVFSVVAVVALGALTKIVSANKKAQTLQTSITNLNFALDSMSRELRVSPYLYCQSGPTFTLGGNTLTSSASCPGGPLINGSGGTIAFNSTKIDKLTNPASPCNLMYVYAFVLKNDGTGAFDLKKAQQEACSYPIGAFSSIIDPNMTITGYYLNVDWNSTTKKFPLATIRISGYTGIKEREKTYFDIQTSVAPHVKKQ